MEPGHRVLEVLQGRGISTLIAISGGSKEDDSKITPVIREVIETLSSYPVAIVTGGTKWSVPKIAADLAQDAGLPVIGIIPTRGEKYLNANLDFRINAEPKFGKSEWGDEAEIFAKMSNGCVMIGGSFGTMIEYAHIMKINQARLAHPEEGNPIFVAPVVGLGGFSENGAVPKWISDTLKSILPSQPITTGREAAEFLLRKLKL